VPENNGELRKTVEKPGKDQPQCVRRGIHCPAPNGPVQLRMVLKALRKLKRGSGMQIQWDVQLRDAPPKTRKRSSSR
jgi:hypothetical protein